MICKTASGVHQETWYDDGSGWKKAAVYDIAACGHHQTSTSPAPNSEVDFRCDCSSVTYSGTDVAVINPPRGGFWDYIPQYDPELGYYETVEYVP
jgi:hypothetical protein